MNYGNFGVGELVIIFCIFALALWPTWRICAKSGNSGALALGFLIPLVNIILVLYLAFSEWPIEKELKRLRAESR